LESASEIYQVYLRRLKMDTILGKQNTIEVETKKSTNFKSSWISTY
jgi:hypothetical protein